MLSEVFIESVQARIKQAPKIIYQRGIEIFLHSGKNIEVLEESFFDEGGTSIVLVVPSQSSSSGYAVTFENLKANTLVQECVCPYGQDNSFCKHIVAEGLYLQSRFRSSGHEREVKSVEKGIASIPPGKPNSEYSYRIPLINFNTYFVHNATKVADFNAVSRRSARAVSLFEIEPNKRWRATVVLGKESKDVDFYCDDYNNLVLERNYPQTGSFLDRFEAAALREALDSYPWGYFESLINFEDQKRKILGQYGLKLNDPETMQFRFSQSNGRLQAQPPENLLKVNDNEQLTKWAGILRVEPGNSNPSLAEEQKEIYELGLLFNFSRTTYCGFSFEPLRVIQQASKISFKKLPFKHPSDVHHLHALPKALKHDFIRLTDKSIEQRISATRERYHYYSQTDPAIIAEVQEFYFDFFRQHLDYLSAFPALYQLAEGARLGATTVKPAMLSTKGYSLSFALEIKEKMVSLQAYITLGKKRIQLEKASLGSGFIARQKGLLYLPENKEDISLCNIFKDGVLKIHQDGIQNFLTQLVIPLSNKYPVDFPESFEMELYDKIDEKAVYLRELSEKFLLIQPAFKYGNTVLEYDGAASEHYTTFADNTVTRIIRQKAEEDEFVKWMKTLNPDFNRQFTNPYFYVSFAQAMKNRWFIDFCHVLREAGVNVYGINELKKFKYNTNKPVFEMKTGSGIDWFDIKIEVHFGVQAVG